MIGGADILTILCMAVVTVHAQAFCDLDCGESARCERVRSTCDYPPCPRVPICVDEDTDLETERPGVCPSVVTPGPCVTQCRRDSDCQGHGKCCFNGCGITCRRPNQVSNKPGTCPWHPQRERICGMACGSDQDCPGVEKCCVTSCGSTCSKPCYHWLRGAGTRSGIWRLPYICQRS